MKRPKICFDIEYKGIKQSELKIPGNDDWRFPKDNELGAMVFNMVHTAFEWNIEPSRFFELPSSDKAIMITYSNVIAKMKAAASQTKKKEIGKKNVG